MWLIHQVSQVTAAAPAVVAAVVVAVVAAPRRAASVRDCRTRRVIRAVRLRGRGVVGVGDRSSAVRPSRMRKGVLLTVAGEELVARLRPEQSTFMIGRFAALSDAELERLRDLMAAALDGLA